MKAESIVFAVAGICFGIILGWVLATQQAARNAAAMVAPLPAQSAAPAAGQQQAPQLDTAKVQQLTSLLNSDPNNANAAIELANTYFDGERYDDAIKWYEAALKVEPRNVDASTDLGVAYYYTNQADKALAQFDYSLKLDPQHLKTLLNQGVVKAFGKEDINGATAAWQKVIDIAPNSPEGTAAKRALDGVAAAHAQSAAGGAAPSSPPR